MDQFTNGFHMSFPSAGLLHARHEFLHRFVGALLMILDVVRPMGGGSIGMEVPKGWMGYHLVMTNIAMENPLSMLLLTCFNGKIIYFYGRFSMATLNNQRVYSSRTSMLQKDDNCRATCSNPHFWSFELWMDILRFDIILYLCEYQSETKNLTVLDISRYFMSISFSIHSLYVVVEIKRAYGILTFSNVCQVSHF